MPQYLSIGDFKDVFIRLLQRGGLGFLAKILGSQNSRTRQTFDHRHSISIWNMVPEVRQRLNSLASGDPSINYEQHVIDKYLRGRTDLKLLSIGCGTASHELYFAQHGPFSLVHGIDLAPQLIKSAQLQAAEMNLENTRFEVKDFITDTFKEKYDVVLFHQSLHHFENFDFILAKFLPQVLAKNGCLVLNEFVGPTRLQWTKEQLMAINQTLGELPEKYRQVFKTFLIKDKAHRPGWWRMKLSDPSESINTDHLLPKVHQYLNAVEEKPLGGNILHILLKDIAHNFCNDDPETRKWLGFLFEKEDEFLQKHQSDFVFGIYTLKDLGV